MENIIKLLVLLALFLFVFPMIFGLLIFALGFEERWYYNLILSFLVSIYIAKVFFFGNQSK